jgi:hypothetical protein
MRCHASQLIVAGSTRVVNSPPPETSLHARFWNKAERERYFVFGEAFACRLSVRSGFLHCCYRRRGFGVRLSTASREERTKALLRRPGACAERNMVSLSNFSLHSLTHRRGIRNVTSAFVGEIAAILHLIETHDVVSMLEKALDASDSAVALPKLTLPPFTIYTADAARLDELPLPAPRKIAYFYTLIASIQDDLTRLATEPVSEGSAAGRIERIRCALTELNDALALGDDILRELRPLLSPKHQKSLTRA